MMQKIMPGQEPAVRGESMKEGRSAEEIYEIIRTIETYLTCTKESIDRIERFMAELKEESKTAERKEKIREEEKKPAQSQDDVSRPKQR